MFYSHFIPCFVAAFLYFLQLHCYFCSEYSTHASLDLLDIRLLLCEVYVIFPLFGLTPNCGPFLNLPYIYNASGYALYTAPVSRDLPGF